MRRRHWRQEVEPSAGAWRGLEERARELGQVHALDALDYLRDPADVADLLAAMVDAGVLAPLRVCLAHPKYGASVRAFRGLMDAGRSLPLTWSRAEAHLFTYEHVDEEWTRALQ